LNDPVGFWSKVVGWGIANPHRSWERETNENTNGLIRQYLRKGRNSDSPTQTECNRLAKILNTRPRKRHNYRTPEGVFFDL
jgi:IS30 family transposase